MANHTVDLKESLRKYFNSVDVKKVRGFRISYKFYTCVTNEFKFKILEVLSIKEELFNNELASNLRS